MSGAAGWALCSAVASAAPPCCLQSAVFIVSHAPRSQGEEARPLHAPFAHTTPLCTPFDLANASAVMGGVANSGHDQANGPTEGQPTRGSGDHEAVAEGR